MLTLTRLLLVLAAGPALPCLAQTVVFQSRTQIPLSPVQIQAPQNAVIADFDKDGKADLAVPSQGTIGVAVLPGKGDGAFDPPRYYRSGRPCLWLVAGDLDGDGTLDLAGADPVSQPVIFTLRGRGDGTFADWREIRTEQGLANLALADFNLDGSLDLAGLDRNAGQVRLFLNNGSGAFPPSAPWAVGRMPTALAVADVNGDSRPDLVTVNSVSRDASLLIGNGDGTFRPQVVLAAELAPASVASGDLNGDRNQDLVFGIVGQYLLILISNGDGTFASPEWYPVGGQASVTMGDLDNDGKLDVVAGVSFGAGLLLLKGHGDGRLSDAEQIGTVTGAQFLALADWDGNGLLDVLSASNTSSAVSLFTNHNPEPFRLAWQLGVARPLSLVAGDWNGDGKPDLAASSGGASGVWVIEGCGDGTVKGAVHYVVGTTTTGLVTADFNQDGIPDLAASNRDSNDAAILLNKGSGTFQPPRVLRAGAGCGPTGLIAADFNNDRRADLVLTCGQVPRLDLLLSSTEGTYEAPRQLPQPSLFFSAAAADLNADGNPDLALATPTGIVLLFGNGDGSFRSPVELPGASSQTAQPVTVARTPLLAADLNRDGRPDLVSGSPQGNALLLFLATGPGTFHRKSVDTGLAAGYLAVADWNGDGMPDIAVAGGGQGGPSLSLLTGDGKGGFELTGELSLPVPPELAAGVDLNGDGRADLMLSDASQGVLSLFISSGDASLIPQPPTPLSPVNNATVAQNTGACAVAGASGTGFQLRLEWTRLDPAMAGASVLVQRQGSSAPLFEMNVHNSTVATLTRCAFIPDGELEGWQWWVRAFDSLGNLGRWSEPGGFRFAPCRLSDGRACGSASPVTTPAAPPGTLRMTVARSLHTATLLRTGKVLIAGGSGPSALATRPLASAELFDPATRAFTPTGSMKEARQSHTATLLPDGKVLLAGGLGVQAAGQAANVLRSAEIYDPATGLFTSTGSLPAGRSLHTATLLPDGRVLMGGGISGTGLALDTADAYSPAAGQFTPLATMNYAHASHTATLLRDGRVLLAGGPGEAAAAEYFIPGTNSFQPLGPLQTSRSSHTATLLPDGGVLLAGGSAPKTPALAQSEIFDPTTGGFALGATLTIARTDHTATALADGRVLIAGGRADSGVSVGFAEIWMPLARAFLLTPAVSTRRAQHTATLLPDGLILLAGGASEAGLLDSAELVQPPAAP